MIVQDLDFGKQAREEFWFCYIELQLSVYII